MNDSGCNVLIIDRLVAAVDVDVIGNEFADCEREVPASIGTIAVNGETDD